MKVNCIGRPGAEFPSASPGDMRIGQISEADNFSPSSFGDL